MAVSHLPVAYSNPTSVSRKRSHTEMRSSIHNPSSKWIDEDIYRCSVLSLYPSRTESETDENLERDARDLGLVFDQKIPDVGAIASSLSATTIASEVNQGSIMSQSTAPTSCGSSERRPSTSLSTRSGRPDSNFDVPAIITEMERKRHTGFKSGLRKMTNFRKKKSSGSSTPSVISIRSQMTGNTANGSTRSPPRRAASIKSRNSFSSHESGPMKEPFETEPLVDELALRRSMECPQILNVRTRQLEEKRKFLEYQTRLVKQLLEERDRQKAGKREQNGRQITELKSKVCIS